MNKKSIRKKINLYGEPILREGYLVKNSYEVLEKLHYSRKEPTNIDESIIRHNYDLMIDTIKSKKKYFKIIKIKISVFFRSIFDI